MPPYNPFATTTRPTQTPTYQGYGADVSYPAGYAPPQAQAAIGGGVAGSSMAGYDSPNDYRQMNQDLQGMQKLQGTTPIGNSYAYYGSYGAGVPQLPSPYTPTGAGQTGARQPPTLAQLMAMLGGGSSVNQSAPSADGTLSPGYHPPTQGPGLPYGGQYGGGWKVDPTPEQKAQGVMNPKPADIPGWDWQYNSVSGAWDMKPKGLPPVPTQLMNNTGYMNNLNARRMWVTNPLTGQRVLGGLDPNYKNNILGGAMLGGAYGNYGF